MNLNDLKRLERRIDKVTLTKKPPTLKMITLGPEDPEPENLEKWTMTIRTEAKPKDWNKYFIKVAGHILHLFWSCMKIFFKTIKVFVTNKTHYVRILPAFILQNSETGSSGAVRTRALCV